MSAIPAVRRMVMFKHGVAYLERSGPADGPFELSFKKDEMNDILKSLAVWVESGDARIGAIAFDKPEDPELALAERKLNLAQGAALRDLIGSFRGRQVVVNAGGLRHEGEIIGLESEQATDGGERKLLLLRSGEGSIALVDLSHAKTLDFADGATRADLGFLVERSRAATAGSSRSVRVAVDGKAENLRVSYIIPAPVWRVSYRLACDGDACILMAWGIVHNPADEDLEDLELTLTTGHPLSFMVDLYKPKKVRRVLVEEAERVAEEPMIGGMGDLLTSLADDDEDDKKGDKASSGAARISRAAQQMEAAADYVERGELFEYRVASRVSLRRGGSAMVPLLATPIQARKYRLWRIGSLPHPAIVLAFINDTGAVLEEGIAVVYDQSIYAGEAMVPYGARGAELLLAFARDRAVRCNHASTERSLSTGIRLTREAALEERRFEEHHEFSVASDSAQEIELVFELRKRPGRSFDPNFAQPDADTLDSHRFSLRVPPHGRTNLKIVERWHGEQRYLYTAYSPADMKRWLDGKFLDDAAHKALAGVLATRERIRELQQQLERGAKEREAAYAKQKSLSEQLTVLKDGGREGELRLRYVGELEAEQDKANRLAVEIAGLKDSIESCSKEANEILRSIIGNAAQGI